MTELTSVEINLLKIKHPQVVELEYREYKKVCNNPSDIPSRRTYFTGRALHISIKSAFKYFFYNVRLNTYSQIDKERLIYFVEDEIKRKIKIDITRNS